MNMNGKQRSPLNPGASYDDVPEDDAAEPDDAGVEHKATPEDVGTA